jgi:hypothetical protein
MRPSRSGSWAGTCGHPLPRWRRCLLPQRLGAAGAYEVVQCASGCITVELQTRLTGETFGGFSHAPGDHSAPVDVVFQCSVSRKRAHRQVPVLLLARLVPGRKQIKRGADGRLKRSAASWRACRGEATHARINPTLDLLRAAMRRPLVVLTFVFF